MLSSNDGGYRYGSTLQAHVRDDPHAYGVEARTLRSAALVAGTGILLICFFGGYGEIMRQSAMSDLGIDLYDAEQETSALLLARLESPIFRGKAMMHLKAACYSFFAIGLIDIFVALALYQWLCFAHHPLAMITSCLRLAYTTITLAVLPNLLAALFAVYAREADSIPASLRAFELGWNVVALAIFGVHLILLGAWMAALVNPPSRLGLSCATEVRVTYDIASPATVWTLAALLFVAGAGYIADSWGKVSYFPSSSPLNLSASGTSAGEVLFMFWVLFKYARRPGGVQ